MSQSGLPNEFRADVEALLNGTLDDAGLRRLEAALLDNPALQKQFLHYCQLHTDLGLSIASDRAMEDAIDLVGKPALPAREALPVRVFHFFTRPTPLSMTVAALVIGLMLTAMAFMVPPFYRAIARFGEDDPSQPDPQRFVAQITAMHQPVWDSDLLEPSPRAHLRAGRQMQLKRGFVELEFRDGAKVVIEAPATWVVESESVLRMTTGQLMADVPPQAIGFTVRVPNAEVVDLGTRFGVLARDGTTEVHVFAGEVEANLADHDGEENSVVRLLAGESIVWNASREELVRQSSQPSNFVRSVPTAERFTAHSTGAGIALGQPDPHWTITEAVGDASFLPQSAVVTSLQYALRNDERSQWISNGHPAPVTQGEATYTLATSFDLSEFDHKTARLRVQFAVDNLVTAIRLNGEPVAVPGHEYGAATFKEFLALTITDGFLPGDNTLEFDVHNANDNSYMGLRVALTGHATRPVQRGAVEE